MYDGLENNKYNLYRFVNRIPKNIIRGGGGGGGGSHTLVVGFVTWPDSM